MARRFALVFAITTICAVLLSSAAALAQDNQDDKFALLYAFKKGDTVRYKVTQLISGTRMLPGASQPTTLDCELTTVVRVRFVKALGKDGMELAAETESATIKLGGKEPRTFAASKAPRIYRISPTGKPIQVKDAKTTPSIPGSSVLDVGWLESLVVFSVFPDVGVDVGSEWSQDLTNPLQKDTKIKVSAKLQDLKQVKEGWITTISETIGLPEGASAEDGDETPGSRVEGKITLKFLADKGRLFSAEGSVKADIRTQMAMPGMPAGDLPMGSAMGMKVEQVSSRFSIETIPAAPVSKTSGR